MSTDDPKPYRDELLLAIDPGAALGWALFRGNQLEDCGLSRTKGVRLSVGQRLQQHVDHLLVMLTAATAIVVERGTWRGGGKGSMPPALLADYNCIVGQLAGHHGVLFTPDQWKGRVPKEIHQPRIIEAMSVTERAVLAAAKVAPSLENNVVDAIGLGLFALGRLGKPLPVAKPVRTKRKAKRKVKEDKYTTDKIKRLRAPKNPFKMSEAA